MRVSFVLPDVNLGGGTRAIAAHATNLLRRGHEVSVVATPPTTHGFGGLVKSFLKWDRWSASGSVQASHFDGSVVPLKVIESVRPVTDADVPDADIVIATWWETAEWVARLSPRKGLKAYFIQHHEALLGQPKSRVDATWSLPMQKLTCSQWLADLARDEFGDPHAIAVPNGVDHGLFFAEPRGKQPVTTVGMLYATNPSKGCDVSLRAFELAAKQCPGLRLIVFGSEAESQDLPLPPGTQFHSMPEQSRLRTIYASCDAWLYGSLTEGFGLPILEAMACRTPVIGTPAGAGAQLISDTTGALVKCGDREGMGQAIGRIHDASEGAWIEMSDAAHRVASEHSWDRSTDLFEEALKMTLARSRRVTLDRQPTQ